MAGRGLLGMRDLGLGTLWSTVEFIVRLPPPQIGRDSCKGERSLLGVQGQGLRVQSFGVSARRVAQPAGSASGVRGTDTNPENIRTATLHSNPSPLTPHPKPLTPRPYPSTLNH